MRSLGLIRNFWHRNYRDVDEGSYEKVMPYPLTPLRPVPDHILKPCYYKTGNVTTIIPDEIEIKTEDDILKLRDSCKIASTILKNVEKYIKVGGTTDDVDAFVHEECIKLNAYPSPLNYKGYPKSCCTSVNNVVCHGIPDTRALCNGDILTVDITVFYKGFHGDCSKTFVVGDAKLDTQGQDLMEGIEECVEKAISVCANDVLFRNIGFMIEEFATKNFCKVIPGVTGHGIGRFFHGPPDIYHMKNDFGGKMLKGMVFTIEPALTIGRPEISILEDGWTVVTYDGARSAQKEHTVLVTETSCEVLTE